MGRVVVQQWMSVDGFLAGPGGEGDVFAAVADFSADPASRAAKATRTASPVSCERVSFTRLK